MSTGLKKESRGYKKTEAITTASKMSATAAVEAEAFEQPIPLVCHLCTRNDRFSDLSHLLTHMASKGHLSSHFKLSLVKETDDVARQRLEDYEDWFQTYNIQTLLRDRSAARGQKQQRGAGSSSTRGNGSKARGGASVSRSVVTSVTPREPKRKSRRTTAQHSPEEENLKREHDGEYLYRSQNDPTRPGFTSQWQPQYGTQVMDGFMPPSTFGNNNNHNQANTYASSHGDGMVNASHGAAYADERLQGHGFMGMSSFSNHRSLSYGYSHDHASGYPPGHTIHGSGSRLPQSAPSYHHHHHHLPTFPQARSSGLACDQAEADAESYDDSSTFEASDDESGSLPFTVYGSSPASRDVVSIAEEAAHNAKYKKGNWIDGYMEVFDSAPVEARRKRNQKKDPSVIATMQANSLLVSTVETVSNLNLEVERYRSVLDDPSDVEESDDELVPQSPKRRKPRTSRGGRRGRANDPRVPVASRRRANLRGPGTRQSSAMSAPSTAQSPSMYSRETTASRRSTPHAPLPQSLVSQSSRQTHHGTGLGFDLNGHGHSDVRGAMGNRAVDVFMDPSPGQGHSPTGDPRQRDHYHSAFPNLALRPGNPNMVLLSPTPVLKRPSASHLFDGKENTQAPFSPPQSTMNPYLTSHGSTGSGSSYNPLCVRPREGYAFRGYPSFDNDARPDGSRFQPINGHTNYDNFQVAPDNGSGYQTNQRRNMGYEM